MGSPAARLGDLGIGHGCFPPTPVISGSSNVIISGKPAARIGDQLAPHGCSNCPPHPRAIGAGASTVFINGKNAARVGDSVICGGSISSGSNNVIIGDQAPSASSAAPIIKMFNRNFIIRNKAGSPMPDIQYKLELNNGTTVEGITDSQGRTSHIDSGDTSSAVKIYVKG